MTPPSFVNNPPKTSPSLELVIAGATGDLTKRKLIPALLKIYEKGQLPQPFKLICVAHTQASTAQFCKATQAAIVPFLKEDGISTELCARFFEHVTYISLDIKDPSSDGWKKLQESLTDDNAIRIFYLATSSSLYTPFVAGLVRENLVTPHTRIALEKPIGHSQKSADEINKAVAQAFPETSVYRVDHYLGKEGVQNILTLRAGNPYFEQIWSTEHIASVQITAAETLGVENRHGYYDQAGALRDMMQNHLLQMLCFVGMDLPQKASSRDIHEKKIEFLESLPLLDDEKLGRNVVRGQYREGSIKGRAVPSYQDDLNLDRKSDTETFVALRVCPQTKRWQHTPFYLRTGKRMPTKTTEIVIEFRREKAPLFAPVLPSHLIIQIAPKNLISLTIALKDPTSDTLRLNNYPMTIDYDAFCGDARQHAYEKLFLEIIKGNTSLFAHREEIELSWRWIENILGFWHRDKAPIPLYRAGSWGPSQAQTLLTQDQQHWLEDIKP